MDLHMNICYGVSLVIYKLQGSVAFPVRFNAKTNLLIHKCLVFFEILEVFFVLTGHGCPSVLWFDFCCGNTAINAGGLTVL